VCFGMFHDLVFAYFPFEVTKQLGHVTYEIRQNVQSKPWLVRIDKLKKYEAHPGPDLSHLYQRTSQHGQNAPCDARLPFATSDGSGTLFCV